MPIREENKCPLATLIVLFYRHEQFVQDTVAGALAQTYPNLEIIFSDDHSPDNTFETLQEAVKDYKGPHRIIVNRNENNMGLVPHINKVLFEMSHGDFIFLNGGDDISMPERVSWGIEYFLSNPSIMAVSGSNITIDKNGAVIGENVYDNDSVLKADDKDYLESDSFMTGGVALAFRRDVLHVFGRLKDDCQTEDSVLRFRSILLGPTLRSSRVFLKYRIHDNNISKKISNFKTERIASQYLADLHVVKESLSPDLYQVLLKKIQHYTRVRRLQVAESRAPGLFRFFYRGGCHLMRHFYKQSIEGQHA